MNAPKQPFMGNAAQVTVNNPNQVKIATDGNQQVNYHNVTDEQINTVKTKGILDK